MPTGSNTEEADLVVVGSGAGGLAAAVTAARHGLQVVVLEKAPTVGGTTAWSGGWIWAPNNPIAHKAGLVEDASGPRRYLQAVLGNRFDAARIDAFLDASPQMVAFFETQTDLHFDPGLSIPDTYGDLPGAGMGGRSVIARPYDARRLGPDIALLRRPAPETTFWGMTIQSGPDLRAFMTMTRSWRSLVHATGRLVRHMRDLALHGRGMDLRNGNALVARLLRSALDAGVAIRTSSIVTGLIVDGDHVRGVSLAEGPALMARRGVVLATGGFAHDNARRAATVARNDDHLTLAVPEASGDGLRMAEALGVTVTSSEAQPAALCPVSRVPWPDGTEGRFPHIIDRGKPGVIGVLASGRRFCNEGLGYHDYVEAMLGSVPEGAAVQSWLICDHRFIRRYGLGIVRPRPLPVGYWLRSGYLRRGRTIDALAQACGIDANGLNRTIAEWNIHAAGGEDPTYRRGTTPYMRLQGDPDHRPNPCVAPIATPPFYAVNVLPGSFGTVSGLPTDGCARVLRPDGSVVLGLYAAGTDAASVFGGFYPAGGINLGPAMTFGFIAGRHVAGSAP